MAEIPSPVVPSPGVPAAPVAQVPVASSTPIQVIIPAEVVLRIHGSNTIGAKLLPALMVEFLKAEGATDIRRKPGKTAEDMSIEALLNGGGSPKAVVIEAHGSQTAFEGLVSGMCDIGMASRQIKEEEVVSISAAGMGDLRSSSLEHVLGLDGIAVVVNKDNPVASLTKQEIAGIFSGQIQDWQKVGGTPGPIHLYARDSKSGTFDTFKSLVMDKMGLAAAAKRFEDSNELSDTVATDPAGIGFVGLPFTREAKALAVSEPGTSPFIASRFTVATEDYLLSRRLFLYTTSISRKNPLVKKFLEFALSDEGQAVVHNLGFVKQSLDLQRMAAPAGAPEEYVEATKEADRLSLNLRFRPSSTHLDNKALRDMDRMINMLSQPRLQGKSLLLLGFADGSGSLTVNQKLSKDRAQLVAREFALRGFTATNMLGLGSVLPVASNDSETGRNKNRRVEVWVK
jgi:phosphate transport system substrate-binding protein